MQPNGKRTPFLTDADPKHGLKLTNISAGGDDVVLRLPKRE